MTGSPIIIGIHGLNNKPPQETLQKFWRLAIAEGLETHQSAPDLPFDFTSAYWADLMHPIALQGEDGKPADGEVNKQPYVPSQSLADDSDNNILEEITTFFQSGTERAARRFLGTLKSKLGFGFDLGQFALNRFAGILLKVLLEDLSRYYTDENLRNRVQDRLRSVLLANRDREMMLVAHSMGSIIAYDVLTQISAVDEAFQVERFVTIGSPLGLRYVKQRGEEKPGNLPPTRTPDCVQRWVNMGDRRDPVALDIELANDYAANRDGIVCEDIPVKNDYEVRGQKDDELDSNPHKSYGYVRTREFSEHLRNFVDQ